VTVRCEARGTLQSSSTFPESPHITSKNSVFSGQVAHVTEGSREKRRVKDGGGLSVKRLRCGRERAVGIKIEREDDSEEDGQQCTCRRALRRRVESSHRFKTPSQTHSAQ
jgi:hypothetical protein